jgi:hypothetical protein
MKIAGFSDSCQLSGTYVPSVKMTFGCIYSPPEVIMKSYNYLESIGYNHRGFT